TSPFSQVVRGHPCFPLCGVLVAWLMGNADDFRKWNHTMNTRSASTIVTTLADIAKADIFAPTMLNGLPGMSSLEVSDITGKRHDHVLRDIRRMLAELAEEESPNLGRPKFVETCYLNSQSRA